MELFGKKRYEEELRQQRLEEERQEAERIRKRTLAELESKLESSAIVESIIRFLVEDEKQWIIKAVGYHDRSYSRDMRLHEDGVSFHCLDLNYFFGINFTNDLGFKKVSKYKGLNTDVVLEILGHVLQKRMKDAFGCKFSELKRKEDTLNKMIYFECRYTIPALPLKDWFCDSDSDKPDIGGTQELESMNGFSEIERKILQGLCERGDEEDGMLVPENVRRRRLR